MDNAIKQIVRKHPKKTMITGTAGLVAAIMAIVTPMEKRLEAKDQAQWRKLSELEHRVTVLEVKVETLQAHQPSPWE